MRRWLLALPILVLPCAVAVAGPGPSKEFKKHGFKWTLPSAEWQFVPVSPDEERNGFVAKVECSAASVEVWAYVRNTEGLSLGERVQELQQEGGEGLGTPTKTAVLDSSVSGVKGKVVIQKIKAEGGVEGHFRKYAVISGGKFYQLLFRCWHGAHLSVSDEINAVRRGFRLLEGAGKDDQDEPMDEVEGGGSTGGSNGGGGMPEGHPPVQGAGRDSGGGGNKDWPAGGPELVGRTVKLHHRNVEWTLPEDSPLTWSSATDDAKQEAGLFVTAQGRVEREKQEFEKDTPDHNFCRVDLLIGKPAKPGYVGFGMGVLHSAKTGDADFKAVDWMKSGRAQECVEKNWKILQDINSSKTRTKDEVKLGNHTAAYMKLEGQDRGEKMTLMMFATLLRGNLYLIWARCWGYTDAYKQMAPIVGKALGGIKFLETKEPVRGPLLGVLPDSSLQRGEHLGEEKTYRGQGYSFDKPPELAKVEVSGSMIRDVNMVYEGRSEDGEAYLYFEVRYYTLNIPNRPNPDPEKFINERAQAWLAGAGPDANLGSKSGLKIKKGSFRGAKGLKYEFTGLLGGEVPFVEEGWVVKYKSRMLWFKIQYGGTDAPRKLKKLGKAVEKGVKFNR